VPRAREGSERFFPTSFDLRRLRNVRPFRGPILFKVMIGFIAQTLKAFVAPDVFRVSPRVRPLSEVISRKSFLFAGGFPFSRRGCPPSKEGHHGCVRPLLLSCGSSPIFLPGDFGFALIGIDQVPPSRFSCLRPHLRFSVRFCLSVSCVAAFLLRRRATSRCQADNGYTIGLFVLPDMGLPQLFTGPKSETQG